MFQTQTVLMFLFRSQIKGYNDILITTQIYNINCKHEVHKMQKGRRLEKLNALQKNYTPSICYFRINIIL